MKIDHDRSPWDHLRIKVVPWWKVFFNCAWLNTVFPGMAVPQTWRNRASPCIFLKYIIIYHEKYHLRSIATIATWNPMVYHQLSLCVLVAGVPKRMEHWRSCFPHFQNCSSSFLNIWSIVTIVCIYIHICTYYTYLYISVYIYFCRSLTLLIQTWEIITSPRHRNRFLAKIIPSPAWGSYYGSESWECAPYPIGFP